MHLYINKYKFFIENNLDFVEREWCCVVLGETHLIKILPIFIKQS